MIDSRMTFIISYVLSIRFRIYSFVHKIITIITSTKKYSLILGRYFEWCCSSILLLLIYFHGWLFILKPDSSRWCHPSVIFFLIILMRELAFFLPGESYGDLYIGPLLCFLFCIHRAQILLCVCLVVSQSRPIMIRPLSIDDSIQYFGFVLLHISFLNSLP
jgi:hypothetical protein